MDDFDIKADGSEITDSSLQKKINSYQAPRTLDENNSLLKKGSEILDEDSERDDDRKNIPNTSTIAVELLKKKEIKRELPNYKSIEERMKKGEEFFVVKNKGNTPLVLDWDIPLLPNDLKQKLYKYLQAKYIQYGLEFLTGKNIVLTNIFYEGRTVNFLQSFMDEGRYPTTLPLRIGREVQVKSQFVLQVEETIIISSTQWESLDKYKKTKMEFDKEDSKDKSYSSWLGFLVKKSLDIEDLKDYDRSIVSIEDLLKSESDVDPEILNKKFKPIEVNMVDASFDE